MPNTEPEATGYQSGVNESRVRVVAAVILAPERDRVVIARRPKNKHQGGLWEFPGGKVAEGEAAEAALHRELREELAISVLQANPLFQVEHDYPDRKVSLDFWQVTEFTGTVCGNEGQTVAWVRPEELVAFDFPAANLPLIEFLSPGVFRP